MHPTITRLRDAMNAHDPDAMVALLSPGYRSAQPAHPNRGFGGRDQVHANWSRIFAAAPDLSVELLSGVEDGTTSLSEWDMAGHYADGSPFRLRGVMVFGLDGAGVIEWARMYVEQVEQGGADIEEAVRRMTRAPA